MTSHKITRNRSPCVVNFNLQAKSKTSWTMPSHSHNVTLHLSFIYCFSTFPPHNLCSLVCLSKDQPNPKLFHQIQRNNQKNNRNDKHLKKHQASVKILVKLLISSRVASDKGGSRHLPPAAGRSDWSMVGCVNPNWGTQFPWVQNGHILGE